VVTAILPLPVAFLILLTIDITILTFAVMPYFSRVMAFWLQPKEGTDWKTEVKGIAIILGILAVTLAVTLVCGV